LQYAIKYMFENLFEYYVFSLYQSIDHKLYAFEKEFLRN